MSDSTGRTKLIGINAKRIMELEEELLRMKLGERPRFAPLRERVILLAVNGLIMLAMAWINAGDRVAKADKGLANEVAEVQLDFARERADVLYDEAEHYFVAASEQGCEVPAK